MRGRRNEQTCLPPARSVAARRDLLSGIAQKVSKEASRCCSPDPPVLSLCGTRQRHTKASLTLRRVCADDASTIAQHCALRGGQKGQLRRAQPRSFGLVHQQQNCGSCCVDSVFRFCLCHLSGRWPRAVRTTQLVSNRGNKDQRLLKK